MPGRDMILGNIHIMALGLVLWAYALYCRWQALRHRVPGTEEVPVATLRFPPLSVRGEMYRRRFWWAVCVGLVAILVGSVTSPFDAWPTTP